MALTDPELTKCAGCDVDFPADDPSEKFCGECHDRLCIVCHAAVPEDVKHKVCEDCADAKKICPKCGEFMGFATLCGDCDGGGVLDVGDAWAAGFASNH